MCSIIHRAASGNRLGLLVGAYALLMMVLCWWLDDGTGDDYE